MPVRIGTGRVVKGLGGFGRLGEAFDQTVIGSVGSYNGNDLTAVGQWNTWTGRQKPATQLTNLDNVFFNQTSWANFDAGIDYECGLFAGRSCLWSVPLCAAYGDLPSVVNGTRDAIFLKCARAILAAAPSGETILIRLGWEFNLLGQQQRAFDGATPPNPIPATWVAAFRHVVIDLFRSVSKRFRFVWCHNIGEMTENGLTVTDCYPGDDVVDAMGPDIYFDSTYDGVGDLGAGVFGYRKGQGAGLDWSYNYAVTKGKLWGVWEWGVNSNAATAYMTSFCAYLISKAYAHTYWNSNAAIATKISDGSLPAIGSIYLQSFAPPVIGNTDLAYAASSAANIELWSSADAFQAVTWSITGGADAVSFSITSSKLLTFGSIAAGVKTVQVRATDATGQYRDKTLNITFQTAFSFVNADCSAFFTRCVAVGYYPDEKTKKDLDDFITAFKTAGGYAVAREFWPRLFIPHAAACLLGYKNIANSFTVNGAAWVRGEGYQQKYVSGAAQYVDTGIPGNSTGMTQTSYWMLMLQLVEGKDNAPMMGGSQSGSLGMTPRSGSDVATANVNIYDYAMTVANTVARAIWSAIRSGTTEKMRKNGATAVTRTSTATQAPNATHIFEGVNNGFASTWRSGFTLVGGAPSDAVETATVAAIVAGATARGITI